MAHTGPELAHRGAKTNIKEELRYGSERVVELSEAKGEGRQQVEKRPSILIGLLLTQKSLTKPFGQPTGEDNPVSN